MSQFSRNIQTSQDGVQVTVELSEKNIGDFTLSALAAWYGVSKFKNKAAAHEACLARLAEIDAMDDGDGSEPMATDPKNDSEIELDLAGNPILRDANGDIIVGVVHANDNSDAPAEGKVSQSVRAKMAAGVARSWSDAEVRLKRLTRNGVVCNGQEFRSTFAAFEAFGLPDNKHIKFRKELKAAGFATFVHDGKEYKFVVTSAAEAGDGQ